MCWAVWRCSRSVLASVRTSVSACTRWQTRGFGEFSLSNTQSLHCWQQARAAWQQSSEISHSRCKAKITLCTNQRTNPHLWSACASFCLQPGAITTWCQKPEWSTWPQVTQSELKFYKQFGLKLSHFLDKERNKASEGLMTFLFHICKLSCNTA